MAAARLSQHNKRRLWKEKGTEFTTTYLDDVNKTYEDVVVFVEAVDANTSESHNDNHNNNKKKKKKKTHWDPLVAAATLIKRFSLVGNTYGEMAELKNLMRETQRMCRAYASEEGNETTEEEERKKSLSKDIVRLLTRVIFFDNSVYLHNMLLSQLGKLPGEYVQVCKDEVMRQINNTTRASEATKEEEKNEKKEEEEEESMPLQKCKEVMKISKALGSLSKYREYDGVAEITSLQLAQALSVSFEDIFSYLRKGKAVSAMYLELCHDSVRVLYSLVDRYSSRLRTSSAVVSSMLKACLGCLRVEAMPRDLMITASVTIWTFLFKECDTPELPALRVAETLLSSSREIPPRRKFYLSKECVDVETSQVQVIFEGSDLVFKEELEALSEFGGLCCFLGMLSSLPRSSYGVILQKKCDGAPESGAPEWREWSLMLDGIIPKVMDLVSEPRDSHAKFHVLRILETALRSWSKFLEDAIIARDGSNGEDEEEIPSNVYDENGKIGAEEEMEEMTQREQLGHSNVDDESLPFHLLRSQQLLEIVDLLSNCWEDPLSQIVKTAHACFATILDIHGFQSHLSKEESQGFVLRLCKLLFSIGFHKKGIYSPLGSIVNKVGAKELLKISPELLKETIYTAESGTICCNAALFLKAFLIKLYGECSSLADWREHWQEHLISALQSGETLVRINVAQYMISIPLEIEPTSLYYMLTSMLEGISASWSTEKIASIVALLKVAKDLNMIGNIDRIIQCPGGLQVEIDLKIFQHAICSSQLSIRVDMLELLCSSWKKVFLPGKVELELLQLAFPLSLNDSDQGFKHRFERLIKKLFERIHIAIRSTKHKILMDERWKVSKAQSGMKMREPTPDQEYVCDAEMIEVCSNFLLWLRNYLVSGLYTGAPYGRRILSLIALRLLLRVFLNPQSDDEEIEIYDTFSPLEEGPLVCSGTVQSLISNITDSWDDIRTIASDILCQLPSPLAGLSLVADLKEAIYFAKSLLMGAQVREADGGATLIRTFVKRYVFEMGWKIVIHPKVEIEKNSKEEGALERSATFRETGGYIFFKSVLKLIEDCTRDGEKDLYKSCLHGLAHGGLLLIRYLLEDMDSYSILKFQDENAEIFCEVFDCILKATKVSVWAVSQQDELNIQAADAEDDLSVSGEAEDDSIAPMARVIINGSWLTIKEVGMVSGKIAEILMSSKYKKANDNSGSLEKTSELLKDLGENLIYILENVKHNGTVEKAHSGLMSLVKPLLASQNENLNTLPYKWLERLRAFVTRPDQTRSDIVRRSAGLPFAFVAIVRSEPMGLPKKILPLGMRMFFDIAKDVGEDESLSSCMTRVHALNMLTKVFNDSKLATDTSGFYADGLKLAILGFGDSHWEIRNAAGQLFSTLTLRMLGFKNAWKRSFSRRAITSSEFFEKFKILHSFFISELGEGIEQLEKRDTKRHDIVPATMVHPSLLPILAVLSRLHCSFHNKYTASLDSSSPNLLSPYVQRCCISQSLALRNLAADALSPLVAPDETEDTLKELMQKILGITSLESMTSRNSNVLHGTLRQMRAMIETNAWAVRDMDQKRIAQTMVSIAADLVSCFAKESVPCPFVHAEAISVVDSIITFLCSPNANLREKEGIKLLERIVPFVRDCSEHFSCHDLGGEYSWQVCLAKLSVSLLKLFLKVSKSLQLADQKLDHEDIYEVLMLCLSSKHYEVRVSGLKQILRNFDALVPGAIKPLVLFMKMRNMLKVEWHYKVMKYILSLLQKCSLDSNIQDQCEKEALEIAATCLLMSHNSTYEKVKSRAISTSGYFASIVIRKIDNIPEEKIADFAAIVLCMVQTAAVFSEPWQRGPLRFSAHACLFESGFFSELSFLLTSKSKMKALPPNVIKDELEVSHLRLWQVAIDLLQDENSDLRNSTGQLLGRWIFEFCTTRPKQNGGDSLYGLEDVVSRDMHTTLVIERSFGYLTEIYAHNPSYHEFLVDLVPVREREMKKSKRLFAKEADNMHEEPLMLIQIKFKCILKMIHSLESSQTLALIKRLDSFWLGVDGVDGDVFDLETDSLYVMLMGILVASLSQERKQAAIDTCQRKKKLFLDKAVPPLISNLYLYVTVQIEEKHSISLDSNLTREMMGDALDPHFHPFFLCPSAL